MSEESWRNTRPLDVEGQEDLPAPQPIALPDEVEQAPWVVHLVTPSYSIPIDLRANTHVLIGRSDPDSHHKPGVDLTPYGAIERGVSRRHAELRAGENYLVIIDLNSTNGTRLNGHQLQPLEPYRLNHNDRLEIGIIAFEVQIALTPVHEGIKRVRRGGTAVLLQSDDEERSNTRRRILIVEDDQDTARTFANMVFALGYEVHTVNRTGDAMRHIATSVPDCVFVDLHMPDYPGTEICRMIKGDLAYEHVPIFMISGDTNQNTIQEALDSGADVFLSKPVGIDELIQNLRQYVGDPIIG